MLNIRTFPLGPLQTNCFLVSNQEKECLIFDPGEQGDQLIKEIRRLKLKPLAILLTHAHFDHIGAVDVVRDAFKIPVYIHKSEKNWLMDSTKNGSARYRELTLVEGKPADFLIEEEGPLDIGSFSCRIFHTSGHSPGSITYWFKEDGFAIVGDTLFQGSIGRTDLPYANHKDLISSIHNKLLTLPEHTICYPGHGNPTTPEEEMDSNPFLNGL